MRSRLLVISAVMAISMSAVQSCMGESEPESVEIILPQNWRFSPGENPGAEKVFYDDSSWQKVSFLLASDDTLSPANVLWYRSTFDMPQTADRKTVRLYPGSSSSMTDIWINGIRVSLEESFSGEQYADVTGLLNIPGTPNTICVRQMSPLSYIPAEDMTRVMESVHLLSTDNLFVKDMRLATEETTGRSALVSVIPQIRNNNEHRMDFVLEVSIYDSSGMTLYSKKEKASLGPASTVDVTFPALIDSQNGLSYRDNASFLARVTLHSDGRVLSREQKAFRIMDVSGQQATNLSGTMAKN